VKGLIAIALFALTLMQPGWAAADQRDSRLEILFSRLAETSNPGEAIQLEGEIWQIWTHSDDRAVQLLMQDGVLAMSQRDYNRALSKFDQIIAIAPEFAEGWNKRATLFYLMDRYEDSLADIENVLRLEPRHFGALSGRGLVYSELEDEERALQSFEEALDIHPYMVGAIHNVRVLRKRLRDSNI